MELFEAAYEEQIPVMLKGPTGCGKTRFVEYMSWELHRHLGDRDEEGVPLITVACHEDLTASDLVGRYLLESDETRWIDGPITRAVKFGAICYLDEVVEARKDTTVLIHPLADYRRLLPVEKRGELLEAADGFLLVLSFNPGYQSALKDLKHSTRQRFIAIEFDYPERDQEAEIIAQRVRLRRRGRRWSRQAGREGAQPARARPRRGRLDPPAGLRRQAHRPRYRPAPRLRVGSGVGAHRRRRGSALDRGGRLRGLRRVMPRWFHGPTATFHQGAGGRRTLPRAARAPRQHISEARDRVHGSRSIGRVPRRLREHPLDGPAWVSSSRPADGPTSGWPYGSSKRARSCSTSSTSTDSRCWWTPRRCWPPAPLTWRRTACGQVGHAIGALPNGTRRPFLEVLRIVAARCRADLDRCLERTPVLLAPLGEAIHGPLLELARHGVQLEGGAAFALFCAAAEAVAAMPQGVQQSLLEEAAALGTTNPVVALEMIKGAPEVLDRLQGAAALRWRRAGRELLDDPGGQDRARSWFRVESAQAREYLSELAGRVDMADVAPLLRLYAQALAGQELVVQPVGVLDRARDRMVGHRTRVHRWDLGLPAELDRHLRGPRGELRSVQGAHHPAGNPPHPRLLRLRGRP